MRQLFTVSHWIFYNMVTVAAPTGTCVQMRVYVLSRHCQNRRCLLYLYLYTPFTPSFPPHSLPFNSQGTIFPPCYWGECTRMVLLLLCVCEGSFRCLGKMHIISILQLVHRLFPVRPVSSGRGNLSFGGDGLGNKFLPNFPFALPCLIYFSASSKGLYSQKQPGYLPDCL